MNASDFLNIRNEVTDTDNIKFEEYFNLVLVPMLTRVAKERKKELSMYNGDNQKDYCRVGLRIFGDRKSIGNRVAQMTPFLEAKGFTVSVTSPSYYTYLRF